MRGIHGFVRVKNVLGDISISGVDGSFDISNQSGNISVSINKLQGRSHVVAMKGSASININPEISVSGEITATNTCEDSKNIEIKSSQFRIASGSTDSGFIKGTFEAVKSEPSLKGRSTSMSGKIDRLAAQAYALHADRFNDGSSEGTPGASRSQNLPELIISASDKISVANLSWKDAIRQKYSM